MEVVVRFGGNLMTDSRCAELAKFCSGANVGRSATDEAGLSTWVEFMPHLRCEFGVFARAHQ